MPESRLTGRRDAMRQLLALPLAVPLASLAPFSLQDRGGWMPLFDGKSLDGWETFLGKPHQASEPVGVGRDPKGVFSIVSLDGGPVIRITGEIYGALTTVREFGDYHLRFEFKWGSLKWPQRGTLPIDTGCCYHAVGPHGASYGYWMQSCEFQIMAGECGNFYGLAGAKADVDASLKFADYEKPRGEWNTLDLYCAGQQSLHVVNGQRVMKLSGIQQRLDDRKTYAPLQRGRIQLQSEGCEAYFRNLAIRSITALPTP